MLDSNILCNDPFVISLHQSHKDYCQWYYKVLYRRLLQDNSLDMMPLAQSTCLWTSFCIEVSNLVIDFSIFNSQYGHTSICSIWKLILKRILSIRNDVDMVHPIWKHFHIFQYYTFNYSQATNPRRTLDCPLIVV